MERERERKKEKKEEEEKEEEGGKKRKKKGGGGEERLTAPYNQNSQVHGNPTLDCPRRANWKTLRGHVIASS